jgi:hypothetical protein
MTWRSKAEEKVDCCSENNCRRNLSQKSRITMAIGLQPFVKW